MRVAVGTRPQTMPEKAMYADYALDQPGWFGIEGKVLQS